MEKFIDREAEMATLQNEYERKGSALVILYGRRRVGKTTLITEFIKDKRALFFLASEESEAQNRNAFKEKAADFIHNDLLKNADVKNWDVIFFVSFFYTLIIVYFDISHGHIMNARFVNALKIKRCMMCGNTPYIVTIKGISESDVLY